MRQRHLLFVWAMGTAVVLAPVAADAQMACLSPEEPYAYDPASLDVELREFVNQQYEDYVRGIEEYINCLDKEREKAIRTAGQMVERWVYYFGDEAALRFEETQ